MLCEPKRWRPGGASPVISRATSEEITESMRKKWEWAPAVEGASPKQVGSREGKGKTPSVRLRHVSNKSSKVKRAPYLNPDAFHRFIGPKNLGKALIDDELVSCLLDNGAQLANGFFLKLCRMLLPVFLFLRVGSLRLFWGMVVRGCTRRDLC